MWPVDNSFPLSFIYDVIPRIFTSFGPNSIMILFILNISSGTIYLEWTCICHIRIEIIHWVIFRHGIPHLPWYLLGYFPSVMVFASKYPGTWKFLMANTAAEKRKSQYIEIGEKYHVSHPIKIQHHYIRWN